MKSTGKLLTVTVCCVWLNQVFVRQTHKEKSDAPVIEPGACNPAVLNQLSHLRNTQTISSAAI